MGREALAYVGLSRARSLEGIALTELSEKAFKSSRSAGVEMARLRVTTGHALDTRTRRWPAAVYDELAVAMKWQPGGRKRPAAVDGSH